MSKVYKARKLKKLLERDGHKCWLCGDEFKEGSDHLMQPSIDHVVPRKFGGKNHIDNIRTAHIGCNTAREVKYPQTLVFTVEQIEKFTNRNSGTGGLSKKAMKAIKRIEQQSTQGE